MNLILYPTSMQISSQSLTALLNKLSCKTGAQLVIPMYRACSFPVLKLYQNITTHLHISHTGNFLPAVTRRNQGLENVPERDRRRGWSFLQEHPGWSPAAPREGAAVLGPDAFGSLSSVKCETPPRKQKASYCFSPLHSLLATTRKTSLLHPFSIRMVYIFLFYYAQPWSCHRTREIRGKKVSARLSLLVSPVWFFWNTSSSSPECCCWF